VERTGIGAQFAAVILMRPRSTTPSCFLAHIITEPQPIRADSLPTVPI
jgi:hypothetical protein